MRDLRRHTTQTQFMSLKPSDIRLVPSRAALAS